MVIECIKLERPESKKVSKHKVQAAAHEVEVPPGVQLRGRNVQMGKLPLVRMTLLAERQNFMPSDIALHTQIPGESFQDWWSCPNVAMSI